LRERPDYPRSTQLQNAGFRQQGHADLARKLFTEQEITISGHEVNLAGVSQAMQ